MDDELTIKNRLEMCHKIMSCRRYEESGQHIADYRDDIGKAGTLLENYDAALLAKSDSDLVEGLAKWLCSEACGYDWWASAPKELVEEIREKFREKARAVISASRKKGEI